MSFVPNPKIKTLKEKLAHNSLVFDAKSIDNNQSTKSRDKDIKGKILQQLYSTLRLEIEHKNLNF